MSGYRADFINELQPRHKCTLCGLAMRSPVQTECGHLFCRICLEPELQRPNPKCPVDLEPISKSETFPDNACKREILGLRVRCNNHASGCPWTGELKQLAAHTEECDYRQVLCTQCHQYVPHIKHAHHMSTECPKRPVMCENCCKNIPHDHMQLHRRESCPSSIHTCSYGCDPTREFTLLELKKHLSVKGGDCPLHVIPCPYHDLGCSFQSQRKEMDKHMDKHKVFHAQLIAEVLVETKSTLPKVSKDFETMEKSLAEVETKLSTVEKLNTLKIEETFDQLERQSNRQLERLEFALKEQILKVKVETESLQRQLKPALQGLMPASSSPYQSPSPYDSHTATAAYNSTLSQRVDHLYAKINEIDHTLNTCLNHNLDCDVRIQLLERATYDGTFLWKIDNYAQRRREAINGTTLSLYSSPFYTSKQGYKMCARVYLNGDGSGKNTHLSFFFCVMRGPNDALLPWPFQQKVTLLLLNQNGRKNVIDQFRPDIQSSSFQRPIHREMNIASGCPMFCPLSELHNGFIKEDCIFLGVIVDINGIPKPVSF